MMEYKELGVCFSFYNQRGTPFETYHNAIPCLSWIGRKGLRCVACGKWWSIRKLQKIIKEIK